MNEEKSLVKSLFGDLTPFDFFDLWNLKKQSFFDFKGFVDLGDEYQLDIELPIIGDSVSVEVEDGNITVKYDEKKDNFSSKGSYTYSLPEDIDVSTMNADVGVVNEKTLTITGKKKGKQTKGIKINVK